MNPEQYAASQTVISAAVAQFVLTFAKFFVGPALTPLQWINLLGLLYPEVERSRLESAELARTFYDSERRKFHPELPVNARELERYEFDWFVEAMEPVRKVMSREDAPDSASQALVLRVVREVENAGRRQIIKAVEDDPQLAEKLAKPEPARRERVSLPDELRDELKAILASGDTYERATWGGEFVTERRRDQPGRSEKVRGWARVATGRETCAWCLVLVSRGPVYSSFEDAGGSEGLSENDLLDLYSTDRAAYFESFEDRYEGSMERKMMDDWHTGCDCKVVPVFDRKDWPGKAEADRALELWNEATKRAKKALKADPDKEYYSRTEGEWLPTTKNREAINQLRKMIADGEITTEWAAFAA